MRIKKVFLPLKLFGEIKKGIDKFQISIPLFKVNRSELKKKNFNYKLIIIIIANLKLPQASNCGREVTSLN